MKLARCYNIEDLRTAARRRLPKWIFEFVDLGAEDNLAIHNNVEAFRRVKLRGRALVDMSGRRLGSSIFGTESALPLAIAPTGAAGLCWYEGELELARAAAAAGVPFTMAVGSTTPLEKVTRDVPEGRRWFQVYLWENRGYMADLVGRAWQHGYEALVVTVDVGIGHNREHNYRNGYGNPFKPSYPTVRDILLRPGWLGSVLCRYLLTTGMPRMANNPPAARDVHGATLRSQEGAVSWEQLEWLRGIWPGKLLIKGILRPDDAERAIQTGVDAVIVSNHGGRCLDSAVAPLDVLPAIAAVVRRRVPVLLDSGIRRGSDIVKALALGADFVMVGRPTLWGTAAGGRAGAERALSLLKREFEQTLAFVGAPDAAQIGPDVLAPPTDRTVGAASARPSMTEISLQPPLAAADAVHRVVYRNEHEFNSHPFLGGFWRNASGELVVAFMSADCAYGSSADVSHNTINANVRRMRTIRSTTGGSTWDGASLQTIYETTAPPAAASGPPDPLPAGGHEDIFVVSGATPAVLVPDARPWLRVSTDGGHTWRPPFILPSFRLASASGNGSFIRRADGMWLVALSAASQDGWLRRPVLYGSWDGANWAFLSFITPAVADDEVDAPRSGLPRFGAHRYMYPRPIQLRDGRILVSVRSQRDPTSVLWTEIYESRDGGRSFRFLSRVNDWGAPGDLVEMRDGRLACVYGYRLPPYGIRCRTSGDGGVSWGRELVLRDDGGSWDLGYPRVLEHEDGRLLAVYYFNRADDPIQMNGGVRHIAMTDFSAP